MPLTLPHTLQAGSAENINDVQDMFDAIKEFVDNLETGAVTLGGDVTGTAAANLVSTITGTLTRIGTGGLLGSGHENSIQLRSNYNPTTDRLINAAKSSWMVTAGDFETDHFKVYRAPATAGSPSYTAFLTIDSTGAITLASTIASYEPAFSTYKTVLTAGPASVRSTTAAGTYVIQPGSAGTLVASSSESYESVFYLDPADFAAGSRTTKYRLRANLTTNTTAPGLTAVVGLYPVTSVSGGVVTLGTVTSGSTVTFTTPGSNSLNQSNSGDFTAPSSGHYAFGYTLSGSAADDFYLFARLQVRQV